MDRTLARPRLLLAAILALGLALAFAAVAGKSVTVDEYAILPGGLALLSGSGWGLDPGVPPLAKALVALPLHLAGLRLDAASLGPEATVWDCGRLFALRHAADLHRLFMAGRSVALAAFLATGLGTFLLGQRLYGPGGGLLAAGLAVFSPTLLGHGGLVTTDIFLATFLVASLLAADLVLARPTRTNWLFLGSALGLATLTKLTGLVLLPLALAGVLLGRLVARQLRWRADAAGVGLALAAWLAVIVL
ncbi:MAG: glycosyltransferase family 39 protein, partial [Thermodesulfobacteriota bacterium]